MGSGEGPVQKYIPFLSHHCDRILCRDHSKFDLGSWFRGFWSVMDRKHDRLIHHGGDGSSGGGGSGGGSGGSIQ